MEAGPDATDANTIVALQGMTNVIPLLARADELTSDEVVALKDKVGQTLGESYTSCFSFANPDSVGECTRIYSVSSATHSDPETMDASILMSSDYLQPLVDTELTQLVGLVFSPEGTSWLRHSAALKAVSWRRHQLRNSSLQSALTCRRLSSDGALVPYAMANPYMERQYWGRIEMSSWAEGLRQSLAAERLDRSQQMLGQELSKREMPLSKKHGKTRLGKRRPRTVEEITNPNYQDPLGLLEMVGQLKHGGGITLELLSSLGVMGCIAAWFIRPELARHWDLDIVKRRDKTTLWVRCLVVVPAVLGVLGVLVVLVVFRLETKSLERRVEVGQVIGGAGDVGPADDAVGVDGKGAARLPAAAALGGPVPYALVGAEAVDGVDGKGVQGVPGARETEAPFGVDVAALVDDHVGLPGAADLGHPALRGLGGRVRDGDAMQVVLVLVRDGGEVLEGLFGDLRAPERAGFVGGRTGGRMGAWANNMLLAQRRGGGKRRRGTPRQGHDLHGQPQWRRKTTRVLRPSGSGIWGVDGAGDPTLGAGATSLVAGVLSDSISAQNPDFCCAGLSSPLEGDVAPVSVSVSAMARTYCNERAHSFSSVSLFLSGFWASCVPSVRPRCVPVSGGDAAAMHEIITLQLGNLSNYTATHFWNAQESYFTYGDQQQSPVNHDVHWRAGVGHDGAETFLPRTVIYDLKGGFGALRKINPLYDATLESGRATVQKQDAVSPSAYQTSLDAGEQQQPRPTASSVRYWSDFSRAYFHPRSLVQLYDFELDSTIRPFERFGTGAELFSSLDKEHDVVDRDWRPFAEECDLMQGIQVFTTLDDAWGGFASSYLEALRDEYSKTCIWVWGLRTPLAGAAREKRQLRQVNTAQTLGQACAQASMVVPLSLPDGHLPSSVSLDPSSPWHVSGLLATVAESAGLPSRLADQRPTLLSDMAESLNTTGRQTLAAAAMDVGPHAPDLERESLDIEMFDLGRPGRNDRRMEKPGRVYGQLSAYRGTAKSEEAEGKGEEEHRHPRPVVGNPIIRRYVMSAKGERLRRGKSHTDFLPTSRYTSTLQFPLLDSFPHIYRDIAAGEAAAPVRTLLSTTASMTPRIRNLRSQVSRSVALEERETLSSGLADIADAYQDDWSSGSDEDDDDL
ncbi:phosducin [Purpureocillium lavendulum]|uniref:Phosducin n=1 Tax=Purpureocillium lavendulum TaxID=1247861 RepID=A0AB34FP82_9HYPO|nr:phosducin [Purpureocillium lavendulum]